MALFLRYSTWLNARIPGRPFAVTAGSLLALFGAAAWLPWQAAAVLACLLLPGFGPAFWVYVRWYQAERQRVYVVSAKKTFINPFQAKRKLERRLEQQRRAQSRRR